MGDLLFEGVHYYIQAQGIDRDLLDVCRTNLDLNGAIYCGYPCLTQCQLILVDTPTGSPKYAYAVQPGAVGDFEDCARSGDWTFDAVCTHFGRRASGDPDAQKERRKKVVGLGWIGECLSQDKLLVEDRYGLWEVIAEDTKSEPRITSRVASRIEVESGHQQHFGHHQGHQHDDLIQRSERHQRGPQSEADMDPNTTFAQDSSDHQPRPMSTAHSVFTSDPIRVDYAREPPSPPLTASSSLSMAGSLAVPKVFDIFTQDRSAPRTFLVACQSRGAVGFFIKAHGGLLDDEQDATFIVVDAPHSDGTVSNATLELLGRLRRSQKPVAPEWIDECARRQTIVDIEQYIVNAPLESPIGPPEPSTPYVIKPTHVAITGKRKLSEADIELPPAAVKSAGVVRKAVDSRLAKARPSIERPATFSPTQSLQVENASPVMMTIRPLKPGLPPAPKQAKYEPVDIPKPVVSESGVRRPVPSTASDSDVKTEISSEDSVDFLSWTDTQTPTLGRCQSQSVKDHNQESPKHPASASDQAGTLPILAQQPISSGLSLPQSPVVALPSLRKYRPDTPPLPAGHPTSSANLPSGDFAGSLIANPPTSSNSLKAPGLPPSTPEETIHDSPSRLNSTTSSCQSSPLAPLPQAAIDDDHTPGQPSPSSASSDEPSAYTDASDDEYSPFTPVGARKASVHAHEACWSAGVRESDKQTPSSLGTHLVHQIPRQGSPLGTEVRLGELVKDLDNWLKAGPTQTHCQFLKALDRKKPGYGWMNHYYRMRRTVRTRLLAMGHDATTLDKHQMRDVPDRYPGYEATGPHSGGYAGFSDSLASNGSSSFSSTSAGPVSRLTETDSSRLMTPPLQRTESKAATLSPAHGPYASSSIDRRGHYHRRMEICERRLEQLITHLDEWLQSGFQGSRPMAVRALQDKVPEVGWLNLFARKGATIRTRLLAKGWLGKVLDEADILGRPDRVR